MKDTKRKAIICFVLWLALFVVGMLVKPTGSILDLIIVWGRRIILVFAFLIAFIAYKETIKEEARAEAAAAAPAKPRQTSDEAEAKKAEATAEKRKAVMDFLKETEDKELPSEKKPAKRVPKKN